MSVGKEDLRKFCIRVSKFNVSDEELFRRLENLEEFDEEFDLDPFVRTLRTRLDDVLGENVMGKIKCSDGTDESTVKALVEELRHSEEFKGLKKSLNKEVDLAVGTLSGEIQVGEGFRAQGKPRKNSYPPSQNSGTSGSSWFNGSFGQSTVHFMGKNYLEWAIRILNLPEEGNEAKKEVMRKLWLVPSIEIGQDVFWGRLLHCLGTLVEMEELNDDIVGFFHKMLSTPSAQTVLESLEAVMEMLDRWNLPNDSEEDMWVQPTTLCYLKLFRLWYQSLCRLPELWIRYPGRTVDKLVESVFDFISVGSAKSRGPKNRIVTLAILDPEALWFSNWTFTRFGREKILGCPLSKLRFLVDCLGLALVGRNSEMDFPGGEATVAHATAVSVRLFSHIEFVEALFPQMIANRELESGTEYLLELCREEDASSFLTLLIPAISNSRSTAHLLFDPKLLQSFFATFQDDGPLLKGLIRALTNTTMDPAKVAEVQAVLKQFGDESGEMEMLNSLLSLDNLKAETLNSGIDVFFRGVDAYLMLGRKVTGLQNRGLRTDESLNYRLGNFKIPPVLFNTISRSANLEAITSDPRLASMVKDAVEHVDNVQSWCPAGLKLLLLFCSNLDFCVAAEKKLSLSDKILGCIKDNFAAEEELPISETTIVLVSLYVKLLLISGPKEGLLNGKRWKEHFPRSVRELESVSRFFQAEPSRFFIKRIVVEAHQLPSDLLGYFYESLQSRQRIASSEIISEFLRRKQSRNFRNLFPSPNQDWSTILGYGRNLKLFNEESAKKINSQSIYPAKPEEGTDWFAAAISLLMELNLSSVKEFFKVFAGLPKAGLVWPFLNAERASFEARIEVEIVPLITQHFREELMESGAALKAQGVDIGSLVTLLINQAMLNYLDWPEVCNYLTLAVIGEPKNIAAFFLVVLFHLGKSISRWSHSTGIPPNKFLADLATFKLRNYLSLLKLFSE